MNILPQIIDLVGARYYQIGEDRSESHPSVDVIDRVKRIAAAMLGLLAIACAAYTWRTGRIVSPKVLGGLGMSLVILTIELMFKSFLKRELSNQVDVTAERSEVNRDLDKAEQAIGAGQYGQALVAVKRLPKRHSDLPRAVAAEVHCYLMLSHFQRAMERSAEIPETLRPTKKGYLDNARFYLITGNIAFSKNCFRLAHSPPDKDSNPAEKRKWNPIPTPLGLMLMASYYAIEGDACRFFRLSNWAASLMLKNYTGEDFRDIDVSFLLIRFSVIKTIWGTMSDHQYGVMMGRRSDDMKEVRQFAGTPGKGSLPLQPFSQLKAQVMNGEVQGLRAIRDDERYRRLSEYYKNAIELEHYMMIQDWKNAKISAESLAGMNVGSVSITMKQAIIHLYLGEVQEAKKLLSSLEQAFLDGYSWTYHCLNSFVKQFTEIKHSLRCESGIRKVARDLILNPLTDPAVENLIGHLHDLLLLID